MPTCILRYGQLAIRRGGFKLNQFGTCYPRLFHTRHGNGLDWRGLRRHTPERVCRTGSRRRCHTRHTVTRYSRQDVIRILHLHARQLLAWERAGLITSSEHYSFEALSQLRKLARSAGHSTHLSEEHTGFGGCDAARRGHAQSADGGELRAQGFAAELPTRRHADGSADPAACFRLRHVARAAAEGGGVATSSAPARQAVDVQEMFLRAVQLEENPATILQAMELYEALLAVRPDHAPALINLGTIHYNQRRFEQAEEHYRGATEADPEYALAFFDLGNVLDEMQRLTEATVAYQKAVALVPQYADAHYNLALAYERQGQRRRALRHWLAYVRLDPVGPWAKHAKEQAPRILNTEKLSIVSRRGRLE